MLTILAPRCSVIKRGYYRLDDRSVDVRRCPDAATNCSDSPECLESTSGCRGTVNQSRTSGGRRLQPEATSDGSLGCYDDLTGAFCSLCAPHPEGKRVYYAVATTAHRAQCRECRDTARDTILCALGYAAAAAVLCFVVIALYVVIASDERKKQLQCAWRAFTPHVKLKICMGFYMIATKIGTVYEVCASNRSSALHLSHRRILHSCSQVELPSAVKRLLATFSVGVSFGFSSVSSVLECLGMRGYVKTLALYMVAPFILAVGILLVALGLTLSKGKCTATAFAEAAVPALLKLAFLAYPLVTNIAFGPHRRNRFKSTRTPGSAHVRFNDRVACAVHCADAFSCYEFISSEWLKADVAIQCGTHEHDDAQALAWAAIILYPVGLLALNAALLFAARKAILSGRPTALSRSISFLYREFEPHLFWWELVEVRLDTKPSLLRINRKTADVAH